MFGSPKSPVAGACPAGTSEKDTKAKILAEIMDLMSGGMAKDLKAKYKKPAIQVAEISVKPAHTPAHVPSHSPTHGKSPVPPPAHAPVSGAPAPSADPLEGLDDEELAALIGAPLTAPRRPGMG
jgi:hypothetical protein